MTTKDGREEGRDDARERPAGPGAETQDRTRTPGDGTLDGATPAGTSVEEMRRLAETGGGAEPGTG
jgi:hypothetical protein